MKRKKRNYTKLYISIIVILLMGLIGSNLFTYDYIKKDTIKQKDLEYQQKEQKRNTDAKASKAKAEQDKANTIKSEASFKLNEKELANIQNVMFVAHPDDEALWGGEHLLSERYLVICMTSKGNKVRENEFNKTMKMTHNIGIMLNYPDLVNGIRSDWKNNKTQITKDLKYVLTFKKWNTIVTHNPEGEYGHVQHKMLSYLTTNECLRLGLTDKLEYFGKFYKRNDLIRLQIPMTLTPEQSEAKDKLVMKDYTTREAVKMYEYMIPYEHFIKFNDWTFKIS